MRIHTTHTHPTVDAIGHELTHECVCGPAISHIDIRGDGDIERTFLHHPLKNGPLMREERLALLASRGLVGRDAETALDAYERTPAGEPYGADAIRVDSILRATRNDKDAA